MNKKLLLVTGCCFLLIIQACKKDNSTEDPYKGYDYFPVNTGHELTYNVDFITKSSFTGLWDSTHYQILERIDSTFLDGEGRETQRIERYIKNDTTPDWTIYKVWTANRLLNSAQREEDNIRYVKLSFPQYTTNEWNGNAENNLDPQNYKYTSIHVPFSIGSLNFDSVSTVLQYEDTTLINSDYYMEQYATNVGMIYKINKDIKYNICGLPSCDSITEAYIYQETLVSFVK
jgi:hypothetical protein